MENLDLIQTKRKKIWEQYYKRLKPIEEKGYIRLPYIPDYATNNGHIFFIICKSYEDRKTLINHLKKNDILAIFHYLSLHQSPFYSDKHDGRELLNSDKYENCLLRLPMYYDLTMDEVNFIVKVITEKYMK